MIGNKLNGLLVLTHFVCCVTTVHMRILVETFVVRLDALLIHRVSNCAKLFLSALLQISTNFGNFGRKMAKRLKLCEVYSFPPHLS